MSTDIALTRQRQSDGRDGWMRWTVWAAVWVPGLLVAIGAGVATAHGLYEVAAASGAPEPIAWLYPLITDGLALVAYASTARLTGHGRAYAWMVVVLAAGLSGLAQASYLAGGVASAPPALRFGVGAWPAIAAAIVAHLLFLLGTDARPDVQTERPSDAVQRAVQSPAVQSPAGHESAPYNGGPAGHLPALREPTGAAATPVRDRARSAARGHAARHGALPTVSELAALADVARGTAGTVLKELREQPTQLHAVNASDEARTQR
jgi:hypothetical protein